METNFEKVFYTLKFNIQVYLILRYGSVVCITEWNSMIAVLFQVMNCYVEVLVSSQKDQIEYIQKPNLESMKRYLDRVRSKNFKFEDLEFLTKNCCNTQ